MKIEYFFFQEPIKRVCPVTMDFPDLSDRKDCPDHKERLELLVMLVMLVLKEKKVPLELTESPDKT